MARAACRQQVIWFHFAPNGLFVTFDRREKRPPACIPGALKSAKYSASPAIMGQKRRFRRFPKPEVAGSNPAGRIPVSIVSITLKRRSPYCFAITDKGRNAPDQYNPSHRPLGRRRMTAQRSDHECCTASTGDFEKVSSGKVVLSYTPLVPYDYYLVDIIDRGCDTLAAMLKVRGPAECRSILDGHSQFQGDSIHRSILNKPRHNVGPILRRRRLRWRIITQQVNPKHTCGRVIGHYGLHVH